MNALDTHRLVKRLEQVGFTEAQAETVTDVVREVRDDGMANLVTRADLTAEIAGLKALIADAKSSTLQWVVGLFLGQIAIIAGLFKLLAGH